MSDRYYEYNGGRFPSVTTILKAVNKPALMNWASRLAAESGDPMRRVEVMKQAAAVGTEVHDWAERYARTGDGGAVAVEAAERHINALAHWLEYKRPRFLHVEQTVYAYDGDGNPWYAGTFDAIAEHFESPSEGGRFLWDYKSGKGVWPEAALQLAAYRYADFMVIDGDEVPVPKVDGARVIHVRPDGVAEVPVRAGLAEWQTFAAVATVWGWLKGDSPIGEAL